MWIHIIKITFRRLGLNKWDTFLSVCCLAVGIFCMGLAGYYSVVNNRYGREFPTSDRIAELYAPSAPYAEIAHEGYGLIGEDAFEAVTSYTSGWPIVFTVDEERNYRLSVCLADSAFFRVFPWKVVEGSLEQYGTPYTLVLTEGCVERYLGGRHVVGKSLFVRQYNQWYTVIAVVRDFPDGMFGGDVEAFCPALYDSYYHYSNLLLKDSSDTLMLNRRLREMDLTEVLEDMKVEGKKDLQVVLMKDRPRSNKMAFALLWIGVLVLAGALFNYYGFSLSRFMLRMRELHLRKVLGASSRGLFYFLFAEQTAVILMALLLAMSLSEVFISVFFESVALYYRDLQPEVSTVLRLELYCGVVLIALSFLFSWVMVGFQWSRQQRKGLGGRGERGRFHIRNVLLVLQLGLGVTFLCAMLAVIFQIREDDGRLNPSLTTDEMQQTVMIDMAGGGFIERMEKSDVDFVYTQLKEKPWCRSISGWSWNMYLENEAYKAWIILADTAFFEMMNIPVRHDRGEQVAYVTPGAYEILRQDSIAGRQVVYEGTGYPVVGEIPYLSLGFAGPKDYLVLSVPEHIRWTDLMIRVNPDFSMAQIEQDIKDIMKKYYVNNMDYEMETLYEVAVDKYDVMLSYLFAVASVISLLVSFLGICHAVQSDAEGRQKEVAIRKINGAASRNIYRLFGRGYLFMFVCSALLGTVVFELLGHTVFLNVFARTWEIYFYSLSVVAAIILFTVMWHVRRILRMNPALLIRAE